MLTIITSIMMMMSGAAFKKDCIRKFRCTSSFCVHKNCFQSSETTEQQLQKIQIYIKDLTEIIQETGRQSESKT